MCSVLFFGLQLAGVTQIGLLVKHVAFLPFEYIYEQMTFVSDVVNSFMKHFMYPCYQLQIENAHTEIAACETGLDSIERRLRLSDLSAEER